jgi:hypothetical protein
MFQEAASPHYRLPAAAKQYFAQQYCAATQRFPKPLQKAFGLRKNSEFRGLHILHGSSDGLNWLTGDAARGPPAPARFPRFADFADAPSVWPV